MDPLYYPFKSQYDARRAFQLLQQRNWNIYSSEVEKMRALKELKEADYNIISKEESAILHASVLLQKDGIITPEDGQKDIFVKKTSTNQIQDKPSNNKLFMDEEIERIQKEAKERMAKLLAYQ